jgi:hypothetical protein
MKPAHGPSHRSQGRERIAETRRSRDSQRLHYCSLSMRAVSSVSLRSVLAPAGRPNRFDRAFRPGQRTSPETGTALQCPARRSRRRVGELLRASTGTEASSSHRFGPVDGAVASTHGRAAPIGEAAWQEVFAKYQQSPQYQPVNHWMGSIRRRWSGSCTLQEAPR